MSTIISFLLITLTLTLSEETPPLFQTSDKFEEIINTDFTYNGPSNINTENTLKRRLSELTLSGKQGLLDEHNHYRRLTANGQTPGHPAAKNINELFWDNGLYTVAKTYAEKCIWGHNGNRRNDLQSVSSLASFNIDGPVGENLYAVSSTNVNEEQLLNGIKLWYDEYQYFHFDAQTCDSGEMCGHYTQLVWDTTRYVGCAYHHCPNGLENTGWSQATILVCNYYLAGNYPRAEYTVANNEQEICSDCEGDRDICNDGLCSGCMNPDFPNSITTPESCTDGLERPLRTARPTAVTVAPIPTPEPTPAPFIESQPPIKGSGFSYSPWNGIWDVVHPTWGDGGHPLYKKGTSDFHIYWNIYYSAWVLTTSSYLNEHAAPSMYSMCDLDSYQSIDNCNSGDWSSYPTAYFQMEGTNPPAPTNRPTDRPTNRPTPEPTNRPTDRPTDVQATSGPTRRPTNRPTDRPTERPTTTPTTTTTTTTTTTQQPQGDCCITTDPSNNSWERKCPNIWSNYNTDQIGCLDATTRRGDHKCKWVC